MKKSMVLVRNIWGEEMQSLVQAADRKGLHRVWTTERPGRDAIVRATEIAMRTERIGIGTGIAFAFSRSPVQMAAAVAEADRVSGGRFTLGLGTGTRGVRERWYGETFENPAPRLAEYADLVREVLSPRDGPLKFEGRFYNIELPAYEGSPNDRANPVKVFGSGLNPTMLKTMSRRMDGLALHPLVIQPGYFTDVAAPALESGVDLRADGRPELAAWLLISVGRDAEAARAAARRQLAFYLSTPSYRAVAEASGWGDVVERLREQFKTVGAKWDELGRLLPQELVDGLCPSGMPDEVSEGIARIAAFLEPHRVTELVLEPCGVGVTDEEALQGFQYLVDRATD